MMERGRSESIYNKTVPFNIRYNDNETKTENLTVRLSLANPIDKPMALCLQLTSEHDPFLLYDLTLTESDFHVLKTQQSIIVDFQTFPSILIELFDLCIKNPHACDFPEPDSISDYGSTRFLHSPCSFSINLYSKSSGESLLKIIEQTKFRETIHLTLQLRKANDTTIKEHLSICLQHQKKLYQDLLHIKVNLDSQLQCQSKLLQKLQEEHTVLKASKEFELASLQSLLSQQQQELLNEHSAAIEKLQLQHTLNLSSLKDSSSSQIQRLQYECEDLSSRLALLESELKAAKDSEEALKVAKSVLEEKLSRQEQDCANFKEQIKFLTEKEHKQGLTIASLEGRVASQESHREQQELRYKYATDMNEQNALRAQQLEEINSQLRDSLAELQKRLAEEKASLSKLETQLNENGMVVRSLRGEVKSLKRENSQKERELGELRRYKIESQVSMDKMGETIAREKALCRDLQERVELQKNQLLEATAVMRSNKELLNVLKPSLTSGLTRPVSRTSYVAEKAEDSFITLSPAACAGGSAERSGWGGMQWSQRLVSPLRAVASPKKEKLVSPMVMSVSPKKEKQISMTALRVSPQQETYVSPMGMSTSPKKERLVSPTALRASPRKERLLTSNELRASPLNEKRERSVASVKSVTKHVMPMMEKAADVLIAPSDTSDSETEERDGKEFSEINRERKKNDLYDVVLESDTEEESPNRLLITDEDNEEYHNAPTVVMTEHESITHGWNEAKSYLTAGKADWDDPNVLNLIKKYAFS